MRPALARHPLVLLALLFLSAASARPAPADAPDEAAGAEPAAEDIVPPGPASARPRLLVMDFDSPGVPGEDAELLYEELTQALRDAGTHEVLSTADVRRMVSLEAERQLLGCTDDSCLTDIAGAMGATQVVTGSLRRQSGSTQARLQVLDTAEAKVVRQTMVASRSQSELQDMVRRAGFDLVDGEWFPRKEQEVAWAVHSVEAGGGMLFPLYPGLGPTFGLAYTFRAGTVAVGPRIAFSRSPATVRWDDFFEPYDERVDVDGWRGGLLVRWPATGGRWVRPYVGFELGMIGLDASSAAEDLPGWLAPPGEGDPGSGLAEATRKDAFGAYASAALGMRFLPRAPFGFSLEGGWLAAAPDAGVVDREAPLAGEEPAEVADQQSRGIISGGFVTGVFAYGF